jgi:hypothetical protein
MVANGSYERGYTLKELLPFLQAITIGDYIRREWW